MKTFRGVAWVHPKNGGDDRQVGLRIKAESKEEAVKEIEKWLKKRSVVTTDYKIF